MGHKKKRALGPHQQAEDGHGDKTHRRLIEQLQEPVTRADMNETADRTGSRQGNHRLHQDRQQHDEAEKNSEKIEAMREVQRGKVDENVLSHARIPHEGDAS